jgi:hypothetical protein
VTRVAIVGHEASKFTPETEARARLIIRSLIARPDVTVVSGACHLGGVDVYAVDEAKRHGVPYKEYPPRTRGWTYGYKPRNLAIASDCDEAHCIVVEELPESYDGMRFKGCYHCGHLRMPHVKSGGCWTVMRAQERGARGFWHIIKSGAL